MSRASRVRVSLESTFARFVTGIAAAAFIFAAHTTNRAQADAAVDAFHSSSPAATVPVLRTVPSHGLALESRSSVRSPARSSTGPAAALPAFGAATFVHDAARGAVSRAASRADASLAGRGYDATAPPALS
jgi:hypothetical protein